MMPNFPKKSTSVCKFSRNRKKKKIRELANFRSPTPKFLEKGNGNGIKRTRAVSFLKKTCCRFQVSKSQWEMAWKFTK